MGTPPHRGQLRGWAYSASEATGQWWPVRLSTLVSHHHSWASRDIPCDLVPPQWASDPEEACQSRAMMGLPSPELAVGLWGTAGRWATPHGPAPKHSTQSTISKHRYKHHFKGREHEVFLL